MINLLARHHLHTAIYHIDLVELSCSDMRVDIERFGIAAYLSLSLLDRSLHLSLRSLTLEVFQLDDVGMFHVGEYLMERTQEYVSIAAMIVKLRNRAVEAALARQNKSIATEESLTLMEVPPLRWRKEVLVKGLWEVKSQ